MNYYPCVLCPTSDIVNTDRRFLFYHLRDKHLLCEVQNKINELGITSQAYRETKTSMINSLIDRSKFGSMF